MPIGVSDRTGIAIMATRATQSYHAHDSIRGATHLMPFHNISRHLLAAVLLGVLASCSHFKTVNYPNFRSAEARPSATPGPPVFDVHGLPASLPAYVPYAHVAGDFYGGSPEWRARYLREQVVRRKLAPDFIVFEDLGSAYSGQVTQYFGYGIATSQPMYRPQAVAYCCRITPGLLGLAWDDKEMVTKIREEQRASGILEGDTLVSIDGKTVHSDTGTMSEFTRAFLDIAAGQVIKLVWIRPGTGRMEGELNVLPNVTLPGNLQSTAEEPNVNR